MRLEGALVELLSLFGNGQRIHLHICTGAFDACLIFKTCTFSADVDSNVLHQCVALGDGGVELEGDGLLIPILHNFTEYFGAAGCVDVGHGDVQRCVLLCFREEDIDHGCIGVRFRDDQCVWEDGCLLATGPVVVDERLLDFDALRDEEDGACLHELCV